MARTRSPTAAGFVVNGQGGQALALGVDLEHRQIARGSSRITVPAIRGDRRSPPLFPAPLDVVVVVRITPSLGQWSRSPGTARPFTRTPPENIDQKGSICVRATRRE